MSSYVPIYYNLKPGAKKALHLLFKAQREAVDRGEYWPCSNTPYFYMDYDGYGFETDEPGPRALTEDDCEALCAGCPLLKQCYDFAVANEEEHGVWGGINFGVKADELFEVLDVE